MPTAATLPGLDLILEAAAAAPTPHQCVAILRDATHPAVRRAPRAPACDLPDMPLILDAIAIAVSDTRLRPTAVRIFVELVRRIRPGELWHGRIIDIAADVGIVTVRGGAVVHGGSTARTAQALLTQHGHIQRERPARRRGRQGWILPAVEVALPPGRRQPRQISIPPALIPAIVAAPLGVRDRLEQHACSGPAPAVQGRPEAPVDTGRVDTDRVVQSPARAPVDTDRVVQSPDDTDRVVQSPGGPGGGAESTRDVSTGAGPSSTHARDPDPDPDPEVVGGVVVAGARVKPATEDQITEIVRLCLRLGSSEAQAEEYWREKCTSLPAASATIDFLREQLAEEQSLSPAERQRRRENQRRARL